MENKLPPFAFKVLRVFDSVFFAEEAIEPKEDEVKIGYGMALHTSIEDSSIQFNIQIEFSTNEDQVFATGTVVTKFGIDNLNAFIENDRLVYPENVLETMFSISFTHTRALLAKNMAPTRFAKYIVPLIDHKTVFAQLMKDQPRFTAVPQVSVSQPKDSAKTDKDDKPKKAKKATK